MNPDIRAALERIVESVSAETDFLVLDHDEQEARQLDALAEAVERYGHAGMWCAATHRHAFDVKAAVQSLAPRSEP